MFSSFKKNYYEFATTRDVGVMSGIALRVKENKQKEGGA